MDMESADHMVKSGRYNFRKHPTLPGQTLVSEHGLIARKGEDGFYILSETEEGRVALVDGEAYDVHRLMIETHGYMAMVPWGVGCEPPTEIHAPRNAHYSRPWVLHLKPWHDAAAARRTYQYRGSRAMDIPPKALLPMLPYVEWVPNCMGRYAVTTDGRVISYATRNPKYRKLRHGAEGGIQLSLDGRSHGLKRVVWEAFAPLDKRGLGRRQLRHLDGDKGNCAIWNLELKGDDNV